VLGPRGASCTKAPRGPSATPLGLASNDGLGLTSHTTLDLRSEALIADDADLRAGVLSCLHCVPYGFEGGS
jgi:hypothetical protein